MTTLSDLIASTRYHLYTNQQPEANRLQGTIASNVTSLNLHYPLGTATVRGSLITIDLEEIRVWETSGTTITFCDRGVNGSTPASHTDGAYVEVMPKFTPFRISQAINDELDDLASPTNGLFKIPMPDVEVTYNPAVSGYDLTGVTPDNVIAIQELRFKVPGPTKHLPAIRHFDIARDVPTADYPSGMALLLYESGFPGLPIHVRYRSRFTHLTNLTDDAQTVAGLPTAANSIVPMGAAIQLMAGREIKRNFTEATSDPLQLELVLASNVVNSYKGLMVAHSAKVQDLKAAMLRQYGTPLRMVA